MDDLTYPIWAIYTADGRVDTNFIGICRGLKQFTIDTRYFNKNYKVSDIRETVVKEVKLLTPQEKIHKSHAGLLDRKAQAVKDIGVLAGNCKRALKDYIVSRWDSNAKHLMFHSSGYDSRIISGILAELREERGKDWIGDIHFRCHQPEGDMFIQIMKKQGWADSQYSNYNGPEYDHYDIGRVDNPIYGWLPHYLNFNFWSDIVPKDREKEYTLVTGIYGGEMTDYPTITIANLGLKFCDNYNMNRWLNYIMDRGIYYSQIQGRFKDLILPYCSYGYLEAISEANQCLFTRTRAGIDNIRYNILKTFKLDLVSTNYIGHNYNFKYSNDRQRHILSSWNNSRFVKDFGHFPAVKSVNPLALNEYDASMYGLMTCYEAILRGGT